MEERSGGDSLCCDLVGFKSSGRLLRTCLESSGWHPTDFVLFYKVLGFLLLVGVGVGVLVLHGSGFNVSLLDFY